MRDFSITDGPGKEAVKSGSGHVQSGTQQSHQVSLFLHQVCDVRWRGEGDRDGVVEG